MQRRWLITSSGFLFFWLYRNNYHTTCTSRKQYHRKFSFPDCYFYCVSGGSYIRKHLMMIRNHLKSLQQVRSKLQWLHYNPQQWHLVWDMFLPGMHSSFLTQGKVTDVARGVNQQLKLWQYYSEKKHNRTFSSRSHCPGYSKIPHSSDRTSIVADEGNTSTQQRINEQQQQTLARWP